MHSQNFLYVYYAFNSNRKRYTIPVGGEGQSGDVDITGVGDLTFNNSSFLSDTNGPDAAGDVTIISPGWITFNNSSINSNTNSTGQAGNIEVNAGQGVYLTGVGSQLQAQTNDEGRAGEIIINTPHFTLSETARITATATAAATNPESSGSITLNADRMDLAGTVGVFAETQGASPAGKLLLQPYNPTPDVINPTLDITLASGAVISASTEGSGHGGDLQVLAPESITISGPGRLAVETSGSGRAGNIEMTTQRLTLTDGVTVSASTQGLGEAGGITLNAEDVTIRDGAQVQTNTSGAQNAGDIKLNVTGVLDIDNGLIESSTEVGSTGRGGDIAIDPIETIIQNDGRVAVLSEGDGPGGNITLVSDRLILNNNGQLIAETLSSDGGNITLTLQDLLLLRHNSLISTSAGTAQAGGNGGNIIVDMPEGFIVAVPTEDSDIAADAFEGDGGKVNITARNILGLEYRHQRTLFSDITASSTFGVAGSVTLDTPNIDPSQGLIELPANLTDQSAQIDRRCLADSGQGQSAFVVTGRGGVPPSPRQVVRSETVGLVDLAIYGDTPPVASADIALAPSDANASASAPVRIVEAQTWRVNAAGEIELIAQEPSDATPLSVKNISC